MKKKWMVFIGIVGLLILLNSSAWAEPTIDDITFGQLLMGESINKKDLKDHVVAIAYTGIN